MRKALIVLTVGAAALLGAPAGAGAGAAVCVHHDGGGSPGLPHPRSTRVVPGSSIGGVALGDRPARLHALWGLPLLRWPPGDPSGLGGSELWQAAAGRREDECRSWKLTGQSASAWVRRGRVAELWLDAYGGGANAGSFRGPLLRWRTRAGIHLGSTLASARRAYPRARRRCYLGRHCAQWSYLELVSGPRRAPRVTRLYLTGDRAHDRIWEIDIRLARG